MTEISVWGNVELLNQPRVAIFNSRQGKTPDSAAEWIHRTLELTEKLLENEAAVISSIGMTTWELVTWKTGDCGGSLILVLTDLEKSIAPGMAQRIVEDFNLNPARTIMMFPDREDQPEKKYRKYPPKDFWIAALADRIYPVAVRPGGNHSRLIELFSIIPGKVEAEFQLDYEKPTQSAFHPSMLPDLIVDEEFEWEYLTHYTRSSISPWPGESKAEFYQSIAKNQAGYSHSGYNTLCRMLREMNIFATDKLIRGGFEVISFTECAPGDMKALMKYRPSLQRWTFEPYGIALKREKISEIGARKVLYGYDYQYRFLQGEDRAYFQAINEEEKSWRAEKEWRLKGNLDLKLLQPEDAIVIVPSFEEAEELSEWSPFPVKYWEEFGTGSAGES